MTKEQRQILAAEIADSEPVRESFDVLDCARCGNEHTGMEFTMLSAPMKVNGAICTHWAECPMLDEPIFLTMKPPGSGQPCARRKAKVQP